MQHNLDISMYSYEDILTLFQIPVAKGHVLCGDDMKSAKQKVAKTHPDKSGLPNAYFVFYKEAFDLLLTFYKSQNRQSQQPPSTAMYHHFDRPVESLVKMEPDQFHSVFHTLFDEHMTVVVSDKKRKEQERTKQWWLNDHHHDDDDGGGDKKKNDRQLAHRPGTEEIQSRYGIGELYDDDDDDDDDTRACKYVSCDVFGGGKKLHFEDVRKVHRDKSVFDVSETSDDKARFSQTLEQVSRSRKIDQAVTRPLVKAVAEKLLFDDEQAFRKRITRREYQEKIHTLHYEEQNKRVLSHFLSISN